jgi:hypothetical protein
MEMMTYRDLMKTVARRLGCSADDYDVWVIVMPQPNTYFAAHPDRGDALPGIDDVVVDDALVDIVAQEVRQQRYLNARQHDERRWW